MRELFSSAYLKRTWSWARAVLCPFLLAMNFAAGAAAEIRFGTFDLPPYALIGDPDGRKGMLRDINSAVVHRAGLTHRDQVMPLKRIHKEMEKGSISCATFLPLAWDKLGLIQVAEILANVNSIVVPKTGLEINVFEDLYGLKLAIPRGSYSGVPIMTDPRIERLLTNGYIQSAAVLKAGRVDAIAGSDIAIYHSLGLNGVRTSEIGRPFVFLKSPLWLQCRPDVDPANIAKLRTAARQLRSEGVFERIRAKYTPGFTE